MPFQRVASLANLPDGSMLEIEDGERRIALCRVQGHVHALDSVCPHRGGPLGQGALHDRIVVCPWHGWEFDCVTGQNAYDPGLRQRTFDVRLENGDILLDLD